MDAVVIAALLISAATLTALYAMTRGDTAPPVASGASSTAMEASRPAVGPKDADRRALREAK